MTSVKGLIPYLRDVKDVMEDDLQNTRLVVDVLALSFFLAEKYEIQKQYHGSGIYLASKIEEYISAFKKCNIEPLFVVRGIGFCSKPVEREKSDPKFWQERITALMDLVQASKKGVDADELSYEPYTHGAQNIIFDVIKRNGFQLMNCHSDLGTSALVSFAAYLDCPIITNSTVSFLTSFPFKLGRQFRFILMQDFRPKPQTRGMSSFIPCSSFVPATSVFSKIEPLKLPILAALLRCDPEKGSLLPKSIESDLKMSMSRGRPMPVRGRGRGRGGQAGGRPPRPEKPMTARMRACLKFLDVTGDLQTALGQLVIVQPSEKRNAFIIELHKLFMNLYPASYEIGTALSNAFNVQSKLPTSNFSKSDLFVSSICESSSNYKNEIMKLLSGCKPFPNNTESLVFPEDSGSMSSLRYNTKRMASAIYCSGGRKLHIRLEDYGHLPSANHISVRLRQLVYGIFLNLDNDDLSKLPGYNSETKTVTEIFNEMGKTLSAQLCIEAITLSSNLSLMDLMKMNGDVNFNKGNLTTCEPSWIAGIAMIAAYWTLHTSIKEGKHFIRSAFIILACFTAFFTRKEAELNLKQGESTQLKLLDFFDEYASQLKNGSSSKTLDMQKIHAMSELMYILPYMNVLNKMIHPEKRVDFLSCWEMFSHGRLFYWMASHRNMKTNHIKNMCMFTNSPETAKQITGVVFSAMTMCDELISLNKDMNPFSPVSSECYVKITPV